MKTLRLLAFLLLAVACQAQYATISANLSDFSGNASPLSFIRFQLWNCGYNYPTVTNSALIPVRTTFDIKPNAQGVVSAQVLGNDAISCGGIASTQYNVTLMKDSVTPLQPTQPFYIASNSTWTPASQPATQPPPAPGWLQIFGNPKQNQVLTQPAGTSFKIVGSLDLTQATITGLTSVGINAQQLQGFGVCSTAPTDTQVLAWSAANNQWCPGAAGQNANASQIQGRAVASTAPTTGQYLGWNGTTWLPSTISGFLPTGGGTLTGALILAANPTTGLGAATKQYVDGAIQAKADLVGGFVPTGQLGSGTASSTTCLTEMLRVVEK